MMEIKQDTKQRIIDQAILEYNLKGVANVTSRDLAKNLGMSHGNLEYHFKNKEALLITIYQQMIGEISESYTIGSFPEDPFIRFDKLLHDIDVFQNKYTFFNLDFVEISRRYKKVNLLLRETLFLREQQLKNFFNISEEYGYLKFPNSQSQARLVHMIYVLITFWKYQDEFLPFRNASNLPSLSSFIWDLIVPRMTESGIKTFQKFNKD